MSTRRHLKALGMFLVIHPKTESNKSDQERNLFSGRTFDLVQNCTSTSRTTVMTVAISCTKIHGNIKVTEIRTTLQTGREREKWHWHLLIPSVPGNRGTSSGVSFRHGRCTRNLSRDFDLVHRMIPSLWFGPLSNPKKKSWFEKYLETVISRNKKRSVSPLF